MRKAVVLLSGGLDSATCLAIAKSQGYEAFALSFRYGQRHQIELDCAKRIADSLGVADHLFLDIDFRKFGKSALTDNIAVPKHSSASEISSEIPITYVPGRNLVFLSLATAWAESLQAMDIFIGVNALDYSGYPDCRPEFIAVFENAANMGTKAGIEGKQLRVHTPLITLTKAEIIREGVRLGVDYSLTSSCYDPESSGVPCGRCDSCLLRAKGFDEAGFPDPLTSAKL